MGNARLRAEGIVNAALAVSEHAFEPVPVADLLADPHAVRVRLQAAAGLPSHMLSRALASATERTNKSPVARPGDVFGIAAHRRWVNAPFKSEACVALALEQRHLPVEQMTYAINPQAIANLVRQTPSMSPLLLNQLSRAFNTPAPTPSSSVVPTSTMYSHSIGAPASPHSNTPPELPLSTSEYLDSTSVPAISSVSTQPGIHSPMPLLPSISSALGATSSKLPQSAISSGASALLQPRMRSDSRSPPSNDARSRSISRSHAKKFTDGLSPILKPRRSAGEQLDMDGDHGFQFPSNSIKLLSGGRATCSACSKIVKRISLLQHTKHGQGCRGVALTKEEFIAIKRVTSAARAAYMRKYREPKVHAGTSDRANDAVLSSPGAVDSFPASQTPEDDEKEEDEDDDYNKRVHSKLVSYDAFNVSDESGDEQDMPMSKIELPRSTPSSRRLERQYRSMRQCGERNAYPNPELANGSVPTPPQNYQRERAVEDYHAREHRIALTASRRIPQNEYTAIRQDHPGSQSLPETQSRNLSMNVEKVTAENTEVDCDIPMKPTLYNRAQQYSDFSHCVHDQRRHPLGESRSPKEIPSSNYDFHKRERLPCDPAKGASYRRNELALPSPMSYAINLMDGASRCTDDENVEQEEFGTCSQSTTTSTETDIGSSALPPTKRASLRHDTNQERLDSKMMHYYSDKGMTQGDVIMQRWQSTEPCNRFGVDNSGPPRDSLPRCQGNVETNCSAGRKYRTLGSLAFLSRPMSNGRPLYAPGGIKKTKRPCYSQMRTSRNHLRKDWPDGQHWSNLSASEVGAAVRAHAEDSSREGLPIHCRMPPSCSNMFVSMSKSPLQ